MQSLLRLSRAIDWLNEKVGHLVYWAILVAVLISAANAIIRKTFDTSSNALLEIQWYLFAAVFLLCAGYTLLRNEHVRIDVVLHRFPKRTQIWVDIFGLIFFLLPVVIADCVASSWPLFMRAYVSGEMSHNAGGLIRWPVYCSLPARLRAARPAGRLRADQTCCVPAGSDRRPAAQATTQIPEEELAERLAEEIRRSRGRARQKRAAGSAS